MISSLRQIRDMLLLSLWGGAVLWLAANARLATYINPALQPYTVAAGVLLLVLAAYALRQILSPQSDDEHGCDHHHSCCHHDHAEHEHAHGDSHGDHQHGHEESSGHLLSLGFKTIFLLLPLGVILFGHANHYSLSTVQNRGIVDDIRNLPAANKPAQAATPGGDANAMPVQVIDLLYAVQMPTYREEFEGKQVEMTGQFVPLTTGNPKGDRFQAIRLFITCCAADAKPVGVTVQYDRPLKVSEMGWVKITGTPTFPMEGGRRTAVLVANKVEECAAPAEPFVY